MISFVVRRSLGAVVTFVMATAVIFLVTFGLPGDPARVIAGRRQVPDSTLVAIRERYGLGRPLPAQYLDWVGGVLRGDLGESYASRRPVAEMLTDAMPVTVRLLLFTVVMSPWSRCWSVHGPASGEAVRSIRRRPWRRRSRSPCRCWCWRR
jgi:peptide/nickel transport system permease protein/oligopeptide transport system permease protein